MALNSEEGVYPVGTSVLTPNSLEQSRTIDFDAWVQGVLDLDNDPDDFEVTWADYYCGAGGSSQGIEQVPGARVIMASNHWDLAMATHPYNHPHADHDIADITRIDPRRHPHTDFAWFSPECTTWSVAKGEKCDYDGENDTDVIDGYLDDGSGDDPERPLAVEAKIRSRVQMRDVVRFSAYHRYKAVIV